MQRQRQRHKKSRDYPCSGHGVLERGVHLEWSRGICDYCDVHVFYALALCLCVLVLAKG